MRAERGDDLGVLLLSMYATPEYALRVMGAGSGTGYLLKERVSEPQTLVRAVQTVASGGSVVDPEVVEQLVQRTRADDPLARLTERERSVLELMAQGYSNGGIAQTLFLGLKTVETHVRSILQKLDLEESPEHHRRVLAVLTLLGQRDAVMAPGRRGRIIRRRTAIIATVVALSLAMEITGFFATPAGERPRCRTRPCTRWCRSCSRRAPGVAWAIGPNAVPARLMIAFVVLWIPQTFYQVIEQLGWLWPIVRGIDLAWAVVAGILVLVYPRGWLGDRFDRVDRGHRARRHPRQLRSRCSPSPDPMRCRASACRTRTGSPRRRAVRPRRHRLPDRGRRARPRDRGAPARALDAGERARARRGVPDAARALRLGA